MKKIFRILTAILLVTLVYLLSLYFVKAYISTLDTITFLGDSYKRVENDTFGSYTPFGGTYYDSYDENIEYVKIFALSYYKNDKERNFIYNMNLFGTDVFIKEGYIPPENPTPETVDMLLVYSGFEDIKVKITDNQDIIAVVSYFNEMNETVKTLPKGNNTVKINAISHEDGGVYYITGNAFKNSNNEILLNAIDGESIPLPENIQNIINSYLSREAGSTGDG